MRLIDADALKKKFNSLEIGLAIKSVIDDADTIEAQHEIDRLTKELTAKEELLKQAVEDMTVLANAIREGNTVETDCCGLCEYDGLDWQECPGFTRDDCFKWRGKPPEKTEEAE